MLELLRIGELDPALKELDALGVSRSETAAEVLWGAALVYGRAGFTQLSADLAKRRLSDIARRWPTSGWEKAWQVAFPRPYSDIVQSEAKNNRVDPALVYAVMREESAFDPDAVSLANAYGLMQLIVPTAKTLAKRDKITVTPTTLRRPKVNVALGCRMLAQLSERFSDNALLAIPAYNAGPGRPARWVKERPSADFDLWVELVPFPETRRYTKRVLSSRAVYAFLYETEAAESRLLLPLRVDGAGEDLKQHPRQAACGSSMLAAEAPTHGANTVHDAAARLRAAVLRPARRGVGPHGERERARGEARGRDLHLQSLPVREAHSRRARAPRSRVPRARRGLRGDQLERRGRLSGRFTRSHGDRGPRVRVRVPVPLRREPGRCPGISRGVYARLVYFRCERPARLSRPIR